MRVKFDEVFYTVCITIFALCVSIILAFLIADAINSILRLAGY